MYSEQGVSVCRERLSTVHPEKKINRGCVIDIKTVLDIYHIDVEQIEGTISPWSRRQAARMQ